MRIRRSTFAVLVLALATACSGGGEADMSVTLRDDAITLSPEAVAPGPLTLEASNEGTKIHEFEVFAVPDGVDANALPVEGDTAPADEMLQVIDEVEDIAPGTSASLSVSLDPGSYAVICNLPDHYANGMHTTFTVG
ncbi:MAG TPA: plastocyanin/azurin family copper-binding protein [Actinomycetota bacterium]|jgi:uncharacterized cupredoxin-like copper-binding protein|nr:plastocyanin/azurin family copper-binding protein [Actinomycetota bacterium]